MTTEELRIILKKELMNINNLQLPQQEKSQLVFNALEKFRQSSNQLRIKEEQEENKRIQSVLGGWKSEQKKTNSQTRKYFAELRKNQTREHLKTLVGSEKLQEFVEKFGGKK